MRWHIKTYICISDKDPHESDLNYDDSTLWVSKEYVPNRIFMMENNQWKLKGKFYPCKEEVSIDD